MFKSKAANNSFFNDVEFEAKYIRNVASAGPKAVQLIPNLLLPDWQANHAIARCTALAQDLCHWLMV